MCLQNKLERRKPRTTFRRNLKKKEIEKSPNLNLVESPIDDIKNDQHDLDQNPGVASWPDW